MFGNYQPNPFLPVYPTGDKPAPVWETIECTDLGKRTGHSMTVIDEYIVIFGGQPYTNMFEQCCTTNIIFNPRKNCWVSAQMGGDTFIQRHSHTACLYQEEIIVFGGVNSRVLSDAAWIKLNKDDSKDDELSFSLYSSVP